MHTLIAKTLQFQRAQKTDGQHLLACFQWQYHSIRQRQTINNPDVAGVRQKIAHTKKNRNRVFKYDLVEDGS